MYQPQNFIYQRSDQGYGYSNCFKMDANNQVESHAPMTGIQSTPPSRNTASFNCEMCEVICLTEEMYYQHMQGSKHQKKLKRKEIERLWAEKDPSVYCSVCDLALEPALMENHLVGVKHRALAEGKTVGELSKKIKEKDSEGKKSAPQVTVKASSGQTAASEIECELCSIKLKTLAAANMHFNSKSHIMKCVKKYFDEKKAAERNSENSFYCDVCDIALNGQATYESHLQGFKHNYKVTNGNFDSSSPFAAKSMRMKEKLVKMKELQKAKKMKIKQQRQENSA